MKRSINRQLPGGRKRSAGFTLMELMIVVAIVAILLAVALPSYENSLQKGRRAEAKAMLLDVANRQESFMLDRSTYTTDLTQLNFTVPLLSENGHYTITAADCGLGLDRCYELTATPTAGSPQTKDARCTEFTLDHRGDKGASGTDQNNCW